jgi:hypothetical protein
VNTLQLQVLMLIFAGWVNRSQQDVIEYLQEENRVLHEHLGENVCCSLMVSAVAWQPGPGQSAEKGSLTSAPW